jgi:hypothetical protein
MPGVSKRVSNSPIDHLARRSPHAGLEPMWPALARGVIFLASLATPIVVTLLSR